MSGNTSADKALEVLDQIKERQGRIDAIAADLNTPKRRRRFSQVDVWLLAEHVLAIQLDGPGASCYQVTDRQSLDDFCDPFPARDHLNLLEGAISEIRFALLQNQSKRIDEGTRKHDLRLTKRERELIEDALSERHMDGGGGWQVNTFSLIATDGTAVCFQVNQGDDGELSDLVGPYEIHDSGYPGGTNAVTGEEWGS